MLGKKILAVAVLVGVFDFSTPGISAAEGFVESILAGKPIINLRYRFEHVDQDGLPEDANASTLRSRLGYETQAYKNFYVLVELESVFSIGKERFNDTINGKSDFPVVADPETTELNQGFLNFDGLPDTSLRFGRQRIVLDNQRFVGAVGFRQNEQTFDAFSLINQSLPDTSVRYAYIFNVNRIFGDDSPVGDFDANAHLVNISYDGLPWGTLTGYAYLVELEDAQTLSTQSYGLRLSGSHRFRFNRDLAVVYAAEFAHQRDYGGNPGDFEANYYLLEPGISIDDLTIKFGYEVLDGDGTHSFQTPLATLHAFNGVTD
ncbi:MAG: alginate export family protein, partial [Gammaproteobacteria bacterium]|nr:alginate export family protein [Gammaproteobacteria bacterium]